MNWIFSCVHSLFQFPFLLQLNRKLDLYVFQSFQTISAFGPNGAIVHFDPKPENALPIGEDNLYLCDSGAQYRYPHLFMFLSSFSSLCIEYFCDK